MCWGFGGFLPSHNLGLFVCDNGSGNIYLKLIEQFLDRYFPVDQNFPSCQPSPENRQSLKRYEGSYRGNAYARRTLEKSVLFWSSPLLKYWNLLGFRY